MQIDKAQAIYRKIIEGCHPPDKEDMRVPPRVKDIAEYVINKASLEDPPLGKYELIEFSHNRTPGLCFAERGEYGSIWPAFIITYLDGDENEIGLTLFDGMKLNIKELREFAKKQYGITILQIWDQKGNLKMPYLTNHRLRDFYGRA